MKKHLDPFEVLQVPQTANKATIDAAFRRLAKKYHPDTSLDPNAKERIQELIWARRILRNPVRRAIYQRRAEAARRPEEKERRRQAEAAAERKREEEKRRQRAEEKRKRAEDAAAEARRRAARTAPAPKPPPSGQTTGTSNNDGNSGIWWIIGIVALVVALYAQSKPTVRVTVTNTPSRTPTRTPTRKPTLTATPDPVLNKRAADAVATYWNLVSDRDYKSAWLLLSNGFRQRMHGGDFSDYQNGYHEMKLCSVETSRIKIITESERNARVSSRITYRMGDACDNQVDFDFEFFLIHETRETGWQIDKVTPVDDLDVSLDGAANCGDNMVAVLASSLNVRAGPGAGGSGEAWYKIKSYLQRGECVRATATDVDRFWVLIANAPRADAEGGWVAVSFLEFGDAHPELGVLPIVENPSPPTTQPTCEETTVREVGARLTSEGKPVWGSGVSIVFENGVYLTSYDNLLVVENQRPGDKVRLCLLEVPVGCPPGDDRGWKYSVYDYTQNETYVMFNSQHMCGGA